MLCSVGFVPSELDKLVSIVSGDANVVDWRRESPLLHEVTFTDVVLMDDPRNAADVTEASYANLGYEVLAHGPQGPLMLDRQDGDNLREHLLFHTDRSTLPYRVEGLGGFRRDERSDEHGQLTGVPAAKAGEYTISEGSAVVAKVGASSTIITPSSNKTKASLTCQDRTTERLEICSGGSSDSSVTGCASCRSASSHFRAGTVRIIRNTGNAIIRNVWNTSTVNAPGTAEAARPNAIYRHHASPYFRIITITNPMTATINTPIKKLPSTPGIW